MSNSPLLASSHILLAGSISNATENNLIVRAHEFVDAFVEESLKEGAGFVVYVSSEPVNDAGLPMVFDWTVTKAVDRLIPGDVDKPRLKIVASEERLSRRWWSPVLCTPSHPIRLRIW